MNTLILLQIFFFNEFQVKKATYEQRVLLWTQKSHVKQNFKLRLTRRLQKSEIKRFRIILLYKYRSVVKNAFCIYNFYLMHRLYIIRIFVQIEVFSIDHNNIDMWVLCSHSGTPKQYRRGNTRYSCCASLLLYDRQQLNTLQWILVVVELF